MLYEQLYASELNKLTETMSEASVSAAAATAAASEESKHQSRGGKALPRDLSAKEQRELDKRAKAKVTIKVDARNKRKDITTIKGLEVFDLDLKRVAKRMANRFACGASVVKNPNGWEEIHIQGNVADDLLDFIPAEYPEIREDQLDLAD